MSRLGLQPVTPPEMPNQNYASVKGGGAARTRSHSESRGLGGREPPRRMTRDVSENRLSGRGAVACNADGRIRFNLPTSYITTSSSTTANAAHCPASYALRCTRNNSRCSDLADGARAKGSVDASPNSKYEGLRRNSNVTNILLSEHSRVLKAEARAAFESNCLMRSMYLKEVNSTGNRRHSFEADQDIGKEVEMCSSMHDFRHESSGDTKGEREQPRRMPREQRYADDLKLLREKLQQMRNKNVASPATCPPAGGDAGVATRRLRVRQHSESSAVRAASTTPAAAAAESTAAAAAGATFSGRSSSNNNNSSSSAKKLRDNSPAKVSRPTTARVLVSSAKYKRRMASARVRNALKRREVNMNPPDDSSTCSDSESSNKSDLIESASSEFLEESSPVSDFTTAYGLNGIDRPLGVVDAKCFAGGDIVGYTGWPVRQSFFSHIPPYILFSNHEQKSMEDFPKIYIRFMKWKLSTITPVVIRKTLTNSGFHLVRSEFSRESNEWLGTWGKHIKSSFFKTLKEYQKLNHFPGTFQIGRKDRLWKNLHKLMVKYGTKEFGFIPRTYVIPQDLKALKHVWESQIGGDKWIIKPPASARGTGIKVINKWAQLPKKKPLVVQRYISNPYLINESKFDLRLYVLVTSFHPLRIYLYPDGLARFASVKYNDNVSSLSDRFMHLTNYSINKMSSQYTANDEPNSCQGHKWTLTKLWEYMDQKGVNSKALWVSLRELVIKTIICGESSITPLYRPNVTSRYNCYELFGVDVLLDEKLKPWLLEVNISPSLHSSSPLDMHVKGPMVQSLLNLAQFHLPPHLRRFPKTPPTFDSKIYSLGLSKAERNKQNVYTQMTSREEYLNSILDDLTGDDVRHLTQSEDELAVVGAFERVFPTSKTHHYHQFMEARYYNRLFDAWENKYEKNRIPGIHRLQLLCDKKVHLHVAPQTPSESPSTSLDSPARPFTIEESKIAASA